MERNKWNWWAFFFAPLYYAGYGNLKKGIIFVLLSILIPFASIAIAIYSGLKANEELPVGKSVFNWKNVGIVIFISILLSIFLSILIGLLQGGMQ